jgi:hypothetical protein
MEVAKIMNRAIPVIGSSPIAIYSADRLGSAAMKRAAFNAIMNSMLLLVCLWSSAGLAAAARGSKWKSQEVHFRDDDYRTQRIARGLLGKRMIQEEAASSGLNSLSTAWVKTSRGAAPDLLIKFGCSATGNCGLYGFQRSRTGWRLVLNSLGQRCSILASTHGGRRDISAYMHGGATGTVKTYWWRSNRYVRLSERHVFRS